MNLDRVNLTECHFCSASDNLTPYLFKWSAGRPDILSCCDKKKCRSRFNDYFRDVVTTKLTLEEARLLVVKSML